MYTNYTKTDPFAPVESTLGKGKLPPPAPVEPVYNFNLPQFVNPMQYINPMYTGQQQQTDALAPLQMYRQLRQAQDSGQTTSSPSQTIAAGGK